jgi:hypothetical protein
VGAAENTGNAVGTTHKMIKVTSIPRNNALFVYLYISETSFLLIIPR